jgi:hypothetical protein
MDNADSPMLRREVNRSAAAKVHIPAGRSSGTGRAAVRGRGPKPLPGCHEVCCAERVRIAAKIMLNTGIDAARDGLAELADGGWMMNLPPRQEAHRGHPAGRARRRPPGSDGGPAPVAVAFGKPVASAGSGTVLPVRWESVEPGDEFTVLLDADIILAPAAEEAHSTLTLAGSCLLSKRTLTSGGYEQASAQLIEASRAFIASVAAAVTGSADAGREQEPPAPAWSWLTGLPQI